MNDDDRRARLLLILATGLGIALSAFGIVRSGSTDTASGDGAIAVVNGQPLSREAFARFAGAVAAERKQLELDIETRRHLLERMVDEELLLQRGISLGLERHEPTARRSIVAALIASVTAEAEAIDPDADDLRRFYDENRDRFARPGRLDLDVALVQAGKRPETAAYRQAQELARRIRAGEEFETVRRELGDDPVARLPAGPLPFETVRQYLGPTVARTAAELTTGKVSDPTRGTAGYFVLRLRDRTPDDVAPFDEIVREVRGEYLRSRGEEALREYLADLREAAEIRVFDEELSDS